ncbi:Leucine rich repeat containing protein BspA family protein [Entamoeba marina]
MFKKKRSYNKNITNEKLDSYSILIVSKYLEIIQDFINVICVCKKFKETTEKLRFNPIPITSLKLFPKIQTQYLYNEDDKKIEGIDNYEIWYEIDYEQYLNFKKENIKCYHVKYTKENRNKYGDNIPNGVNYLDECCFYRCHNLTNITIPIGVTAIGNDCFRNCYSLQSVELPYSVSSIGDYCFVNCWNMVSFTGVTGLKIGIKCFNKCDKLLNWKTINTSK